VILCDAPFAESSHGVARRKSPVITDAVKLAGFSGNVEDVLFGTATKQTG
jgi:hypothetical protein